MKEKEIRQIERFYNSILDLQSSGIALISQQKEIIYFNKPMIEIFINKNYINSQNILKEGKGKNNQKNSDQEFIKSQIYQALL